MPDIQAKNNNTLRIGLIVDSNVSSQYVFDLADWGQRQSNLQICCLVIQRVSASKQQNTIAKVVSFLKKHGALVLAQEIGFTLIHKVEEFIIRRTKNHKHHASRHDLSYIVKDSISVKPIISKSGFVYRYDDGDIEKIRELGLDVLIRCGTGILRGEILRATRFGILSFHHADNRINRGGPAGFWEVYLRQDSTGFTIQQLTEELDGGNVLYRGHFPTKFYYLLNQAALLEKSNFYLKKLLSDIATKNELPSKLDSFPYFNPLYKTPNIRTQCLYCVSLASISFKKLIHRFVLKKENRWGVAFCFSNWRDLVMWRGIRIKNPPNHFLADPFVVNVDGENYCFVEDYDYTISKGCISVYRLLENGSERIGEAIVEPFHMSYPYIFEYQSKYYMCPETCESRDIRLYECESFPLKWRLKKLIKSNVSAVDTTIFEKDGLWWLFTNIDPIGTGDRYSALFIFYGDNPLTDNWTPHPKNPVFVDSRKGRMGGILFDNDFIYRVAQQQGFDTYGKSVSINQITDLSTESYEEEVLTRIEPNFFHKVDGTHHMHSNGTITVFDFFEKVKVSTLSQ